MITKCAWKSDQTLYQLLRMKIWRHKRGAFCLNTMKELGGLCHQKNRREELLTTATKSVLTLSKRVSQPLSLAKKSRALPLLRGRFFGKSFAHAWFYLKLICFTSCLFIKPHVKNVSLIHLGKITKASRNIFNHFCRLRRSFMWTDLWNSLDSLKYVSR